MNEISVPGLPPPPPEMIAEIAYGLQEPVDIAFRFGYAKSEYEQLEQNRYFVAAVMSARSELERNGHSVKIKARFMTENLMEDVYTRAKSPTASIGQVLDAVKVLSRLGDLEPKPQAEKGTNAPATSVQIIFNGGPAAEMRIGGPTKEVDEQLTFEIPLQEKKDDDDQVHPT